MLWPCKIKYHACVHFVMLLKSESTSYSLADKCTQNDICVCSARAFFAYICKESPHKTYTLPGMMFDLALRQKIRLYDNKMHGTRCVARGWCAEPCYWSALLGMHTSPCLMSQGSQYQHISREKIGSICDKEYLISPLVPHISIYISQGKKEVYMIRNISSPPSATYLRLWIRSTLVKIMACRLFSAKPFSEPMLGYCQWDP